MPDEKPPAATPARTRTSKARPAQGAAKADPAPATPVKAAVGKPASGKGDGKAASNRLPPATAVRPGSGSEGAPAALPHVNIVKLCVGAEGVDDLLRWQKARFGDGPVRHITRMWPRREAEVLAGGSLYWVFKGVILGRQRIAGLDEHRGEDGIARCAISLDPAFVRTAALPRRPFQGWRYLSAADAPADLPEGREREEPLPPLLAQALAEMGLR